MFAAVCFFFPFRNTLVFGQANASILFVWTLGVYLLKRQRPMASALCFALGTVLKVSPVVAVPLLALRRQWRWLAAYVVGVVAFTGASIWRLGWQTNLTWLTAIYPSISSGLGNICQPLIRRPRRCAVRSQVFRHPYHDYRMARSSRTEPVREGLQPGDRSGLHFLVLAKKERRQGPD